MSSLSIVWVYGISTIESYSKPDPVSTYIHIKCIRFVIKQFVGNIVNKPEVSCLNTVE